MNRTTAIETWREACGSDTVMASMPPTGRMLEEFATRIEAMAREACAKQLELSGPDVLLMAGEMTRGELGAVMAVLSCLRVRMRSNYI